MNAEPRLITFGCRLNSYESEIILSHARAAGRSNLIVVNTCAVTAEAERQARQAIRRSRRENPDAAIVVTGCAAQIRPEAYAGMPEVDRIIGNDLKLHADAWAAGEDGAGAVVDDFASVRDTAGHLIDGFKGRARAYVQIQNGCDHRCTFCVIPFGRGPSRSVAIGEIVRQTRTLVESGTPEIVLTGVDLTAYGADLPGKPTLGQMVRRLLALVPELPRLRLSSLDPGEIDDDLWRVIGDEPRLMPHLHLSVQAGDDLVLKRMKRRHDRDSVIRCCQRARALRPGIALGADLIAGFPTETDAMFANTLDLVDECGLVYLHVFPFSGREGTPAARMPQVPKPVRKQRAAQLRAAGGRVLAAFLAGKVGGQAHVLVEEGTTGRTEDYAAVRLDRPASCGDLVPVRFTAVTDDTLQGRILAEPAAV